MELSFWLSIVGRLDTIVTLQEQKLLSTIAIGQCSSRKNLRYLKRHTSTYQRERERGTLDGCSMCSFCFYYSPSSASFLMKNFLCGYLCRCVSNAVECSETMMMIPAAVPAAGVISRSSQPSSIPQLLVYLFFFLFLVCDVYCT